MRSQSATASSDPARSHTEDAVGGVCLSRDAAASAARHIGRLEPEFERMTLDASQVEHVTHQAIEPAGLGDDAREPITNRNRDITPA